MKERKSRLQQLEEEKQRLKEEEQRLQEEEPILQKFVEEETTPTQTLKRGRPRMTQQTPQKTEMQREYEDETIPTKVQRMMPREIPSSNTQTTRAPNRDTMKTDTKAETPKEDSMVEQLKIENDIFKEQQLLINDGAFRRTLIRTLVTLCEIQLQQCGLQARQNEDLNKILVGFGKLSEVFLTEKGSESQDTEDEEDPNESAESDDDDDNISEEDKRARRQIMGGEEAEEESDE